MLGKLKGDGNAGTPFWLRWAVIGVLAYMFFVSYQNRGNEEVERRASYDTNKGEIVRATPGDSITLAGNRVTSAKQARGIQVGGDIAGRGATASCGETANVTVSMLLPDGVVLSDEQKKTFIPAESATVKVSHYSDENMWRAGITGMKTGGVREVIVPADKVFGKELAQSFGLASNSHIRYKVTLTDLSPKHPEATLPFRAMDSSIGNGRIAGCGSQVTALLTLWNAKGERIYVTPKPVTYVLGQSKFIYGLDRGTLGMKTGGVRILTIPPAYQRIGGQEYSKIAGIGDLQHKLTSDGVLIVDVKAISVEKPKN